MALHEDFKLEKTAEYQNCKNRAANNPDNGIANGLPWLSYAGGLGGGSPPVLISVILCFLKVKAKKSTLLESNELKFTPKP